MPAPALLGCPHCSKPISFAPELAGQIVACPHCRKQLQMPASPPAPPAPPPGPPPIRNKPPLTPSTAPTQGGPTGRSTMDFSFPTATEPQQSSQPLPDRRGVERPAIEPVWYRRTEFLATATMWLGIVGSVAFAALVFHFSIIPLFRSGEPRLITSGVLSAVGTLLMLAAAVTAFMLLRALAFVIVDGVRHLRAIKQK